MSQCGCEPVHFTVQYNLEPNLSWLIEHTKASCNPACCISSTSKSPQHKTASSFGWIQYPDICCTAHSPHADRCSHSSHTICMQGQQSRSSRPDDHRTNALTEIASLTLCLQGEKPVYRLYRSTPTRTYSPDIKESCGNLGMSNHKFERGGHTFSAGVAWNKIRPNILTDRLAWVALSCGSRGTWNRRSCNWALISMRADVKWIRILLPSQDYSKD